MRRTVIIFAISIFLLGLGGCSSSDKSKTAKKDITVDNPGKNETTQMGATEGSSDIASTEDDESSDEQSTGYTLRRLSNGGDYCSNENGYYYIDAHSGEFKLKNGKSAYHIMYIDYATRKEVFLCNNTGCKHNTEACTSVITNKSDTEKNLFFHSGKLYLLDRAHDEEGSTSYTIVYEDLPGLEIGGSGNDIPSILYCMNPDGTDRKKVLEFDKGITIDDIVLEDDNGLYFIEKKIETQMKKAKKKGSNLEYSVATEKKLVRIDDASNEKETVCNLMFDDQGNATWRVLGCFDSYLVMYAFVKDRQLSAEEEIKALEDSDYGREIFKKSKWECVVVDIMTGQFKKICSFSSEKMNSFEQKDQFLYVILDGDNKIKKIDLLSGKKSVLAELDDIGVCKIFDGRLRCTSWDDKNKTNYFIDLDSGKVEKRTIDLRTKSLGWSIEFRAETEKDFLVIYDYKAKKSERDPRDTGGDSYEIEQNRMALLSKEDFYNNKANYRPIDMVGSGGAEQ